VGQYGNQIFKVRSTDPQLFLKISSFVGQFMFCISG
jgi:hypothetical protein